MKTLVYTFRTFPETDRLIDIFGKVFIFSQLHKDFDNFKYLIDRIKPDQILGIAISKGPSKIETIAINSFTKEKKILKNGNPMYSLNIPRIDFPASEKPTNTFCNWTMYMLADHLFKNHITSKLSFIHVNKRDISKLRSVLC